jgi:hypothetical protein
MTIGVATLATMALGGFAADAATRRWLLALGFLTLVAYGTIAVGRTTSLEFLKVPAAHAAAWPRYHYLALALTLAGTALAAVRRRGAAARLADSATVSWAMGPRAPRLHPPELRTACIADHGR